MTNNNAVLDDEKSVTGGAPAEDGRTTPVETGGPDETDSSDREPIDGGHKHGRRTGTTIRLTTVVVALAIVLLGATAVAFGALYFSAEQRVSQQEHAEREESRAIQIATDYALGASTIDFQDVPSWLDRLKANTSPQLAAKFDATASQLQQILLPLRWTSKATPISAVVESASDGVIKVNVFVNVNTTNAQAPDGGQSTATYALTIDKRSDWVITDVGGLDTALPGN